ncbi:hypothetical protein D3C72_1819450 [compost metagenome]
MDEQPAAEAERVTVGFLGGRAGGRPDMGDEQRRPHRAGGLAQVGVAPCRVQAAIAERQFRVPPVPAHAEAVAVRRGVTQPGVQALVDQGVLGLEQHSLERDGTAGIGQPAAHGGISWVGALHFRIATTRVL